VVHIPIFVVCAIINKCGKQYEAEDPATEVIDSLANLAKRATVKISEPEI